MLRLTLKSVAIVAIALSISFSASAQQPKMAVGVYAAVGTGITYGIGGKFQYLITDHFRLEASPAFLFGGESGVLLTVLDLDVHAHYRFSIGNVEVNNQEHPINMYLYPLAGLGVYRTTATINILGHKDKESDTLVGTNIGAGFEFYNPNNRCSWFIETKWGLGKDWSRFTAQWGIAYHF